MNIQTMMNQARKLQKELEKTTKEIDESTFTYENENILVVTHGDVILGFQEYFNRRSDGYPKTCELSKYELN